MNLLEHLSGKGAGNVFSSVLIAASVQLPTLVRPSEAHADGLKENFNELRMPSMRPSSSNDSSVRVVPRIVGGTPITDPSRLGPTVAIIGTKGEYSAQYCGGGLIAPDIVVTAGHCVATLQPGVQLSVAVGQVGPDEQGHFQGIPVKEIVIHPRYFIDDDYRVHHDLAVLKLAYPVPGAKKHRIASRRALQKGQSKGEKVLVRGFGAKTNNPLRDHSPSDAHQVKLSLLPNAACTKLLGSEFDPSSQVCLRGEPIEKKKGNRFSQRGYRKDSCAGDSGTIVTLKRQLLAVVSGGPDICGHPDGASLNTPLPYYKRWIQKVMAHWNSTKG